MSRYYRYTSKYKPLGKLCQTAISRSGYIMQKKENSIIEGTFMRAVDRAKKLLTQTPITYFERDERKDTSHSPFAMHTFLSRSLYLHLECNIMCEFQIQYAFNHCSYEKEIREMLKSYPLEGRVKEVELSPDFSTFYDAVLRFQDKKFIRTL
jgi:hypothetical protein